MLDRIKLIISLSEHFYSVTFLWEALFFFFNYKIKIS
jgi:hypothetical protein